MTALRVLVADDESIARERAVRLLRAIPGVEIAGECTNGEQVIAALEHEDVDVILLDIQMPGLTGLDTAALLPEDGPYVVFATAHPEHAVRAFDLGATDYLLKPLEASRLVRAVDRARAHLERPRPSVPATTRLAVPTRSGIVLVLPSEISHAVWDGAIVTIHATGRTLLADTSLQELLARLPGDVFERVHRRAIVNLDHVTLLEPTDPGGFLARLSNGATVEVSRQAARRLRRRLGLAGERDGFK